MSYYNGNQVTWNPNTQNPAQRQFPYQGSTTAPAGLYPNGYVMPPRNGKVPVGSQNPDGTFNGAFRGIGVVNPWGGYKRKKSKRNRTKTKRSRRTRRTRRSRK